MIREAIPKYREDLGVGAYQIDVRYMDDQDSCRPLTAMMIHVDQDYLRATVTVFPNALADWKRDGDEKLLERVAHEIAHLATQPMRDLIERPTKSDEEVRIAWEALTTIVGRYVYENVKNRK